MDSYIKKQLADGAIVITPNRRLARFVRTRYDEAQQAHCWPTPLVLPWPTWLRTLWDQAQMDSAHPQFLLSDWQERSLWEVVIAANSMALLSPAASLARLAQQAWSLLHAWGGELKAIQRISSNQDVAQFIVWAKNYARRCDKNAWLDQARLTTALIEQPWPAPAKLILLGFVELSPQQKRLIETCVSRGAAVEHYHFSVPAIEVARFAALDTADEIDCAVRWSKRKLNEQPKASIGIVIADLPAQRSAVLRKLQQVFPDDQPFNLSLGLPLNRFPIIDAALGWLHWHAEATSIGRAGMLLRSPYIRGAWAERETRSEVERQLRQAGWSSLNRQQLMMALPAVNVSCPELLPALSRWVSAAAPISATPQRWRKHWQDLLSSLGFPGERALSSEHYQALVAWQELLTEWETRSTVQAELDTYEAHASLIRIAEETLFQPETPDKPIQVLGSLEAAGLPFDYLWVCGMTAEEWPAAVKPHPFLPLSWQRTQGLAQASAEKVLSYAQKLIAGFAAAAGQVLFSFPTREEDRPIEGSALINIWPMLNRTVLNLAEPATLPNVELETWLDPSGTPLNQDKQATLKQGTTLLERQAACPFQAYACHRLQSEAWPRLEQGLTARERGGLVHRALAYFWQRVVSSKALAALSDQERIILVQESVAHALNSLTPLRWTVLPALLRTVEQQRIAALIEEWLNQERRRGDFTVLAVEQKRPAVAGPLKFNIRIDRIDQLDEGSTIVIDYKTGRLQHRGGMAGLWSTRLDLPQLPLYALSLEQEVKAVVYAQVRAHETKALGIADHERLWPGLTLVSKTEQRTWPKLLEFWRQELNALATEFQQGHAVVQPKRSKTCQLCEQAAFCRINELGNIPVIEDFDVQP